MASAALHAGARPRLVIRALPYVLAVLFGVWGLRGVSSNAPVDTDAARHLMNGVFLHDLAREGKFTVAPTYARQYYSRFPALSLGYHPPGFPAFESLFFFAFGVNLMAARLAIVAATAAAVLLMYRLIMATHGSRAIAAISVVVVFALPFSLRLANDTMLEIPALALTLAAIWQLRDLDRGYPLRRGLAFAALAAAAVWTKQNTVFLGVVPFLYVVLARRWRLLGGKTIWISSAVFGVLVSALALISVASGGAGNRHVPSQTIWQVMAHNVPYYLDALRAELGLIPAAIVLITLVVAIARRPGVNALYAAWAMAVFLETLFLPLYDSRYLFFACPPLIVIALDLLFRASHAVRRKRAWLLPAAAALAWAAVNLRTPATFLYGPQDAAALVVRDSPRRILYCGRANGAFIFSVRALSRSSDVLVIRGDKLSASMFPAAEFEKFAHDFGITHIVLERRSMARPWDPLFEQASASMRLVRELPFESSDPKLVGKLRVYRFQNPSPNPEKTLRLRLLSGGDFEAEL